jgi:GMP synthase-like glutamine amidotransferase
MHEPWGTLRPVRVVSVDHGPLVRSELFADVIAAEGHELVEWEIGGPPRPDGPFDAWIVLGGHQNVGEEEEYPWLHEEYDLLRELVATETPLFAICLGAQALSHAFGGEVRKLPAQQAGFAEVSLTEEGARDPVLGVLPPRFEALVGNSYGFDVPADGVELAASEVQPQAFRIGERAWAVQFHPEARKSNVTRWFAEDERAGTLPRSLPELEQELEAKIGDWHVLGRALCLAFLAAASPAGVSRGA